jgi:hypothetical protein
VLDVTVMADSDDPATLRALTESITQAVARTDGSPSQVAEAVRGVAPDVELTADAPLREFPPSGCR